MHGASIGALSTAASVSGARAYHRVLLLTVFGRFPNAAVRLQHARSSCPRAELRLAPGYPGRGHRRELADMPRAVLGLFHAYRRSNHLSAPGRAPMREEIG